ncbi:MAG: OprO/OprP family phosphate-selective porin [Prevotella sp.]|nr:OprO/OprP family phosphate-selective porin [Prevotella sp.]
MKKKTCNSSTRHGRFALLRTLAVMLAVFSSVAAMGQQEQKKSEPDWLKDFTSRITFNGYAQGGWSYQDSNGKPTNAYNLKRTLLWAKARITDRWSFMFMHDFSSVVQEFYTDYRLTKDNSLTVRLGQFKHAYSMENPLSPTQLELIDVYSQAVLYLAGEGPDPLNGVNYGRDMGLELYGELAKGAIRYNLALMSGQGINRRDLNNQKDFIAKLEVRPMNGLRLVASGYLGTGCAVNTAAWNPDIKVGDNYKRNRYSVGAEYKTAAYSPAKYKEARPASIRAEWLGGKDGEVGSMGGYVTTSIPVFDALDIVASGETFDRNTKVDGWDQTNLTIGVQYWFYKKCRMQLQYTRCLCGENISSKDYNWLQAQMQVAF